MLNLYLELIIANLCNLLDAVHLGDIFIVTGGLPVPLLGLQVLLKV